MIKPFNELVKVDISKYLVKKPNFIWDKTNKELRKKIKELKNKER